MYHTEPPTDKTIREWYMNSSRVAACSFRSAQALLYEATEMFLRAYLRVK